MAILGLCQVRAGSWQRLNKTAILASLDASSFCPVRPVIGSWPPPFQTSAPRGPSFSPSVSSWFLLCLLLWPGPILLCPQHLSSPCSFRSHLTTHFFRGITTGPELKAFVSEVSLMGSQYSTCWVRATQLRLYCGDRAFGAATTRAPLRC